VVLTLFSRGRVGVGLGRAGQGGAGRGGYKLPAMTLPVYKFFNMQIKAANLFHFT